MRPAPPVQVPCDGGRAWRAIEVMLPAIALATAAGWAAERFEAPTAWVVALALLAGSLAAALALRTVARSAPVLAWDGQRWTLRDQAGHPEVMIDLGTWLLLRFRGASPAPARWIAVAARHAGPAFGLWRAALYSSVAQPTSTSR